MVTKSSSNTVCPYAIFQVRASLTALVSLVATLGVAGCGASGAPSSGEPDASFSSPGTSSATLKLSEAALRTVQALRTQFKLPTTSLAHRLRAHRALPALLPPHASASKSRALLVPSSARSYELTDTWLRPVFPKGIRAGVLKPAKVRLGSTAREVARVQDESSGAAITVQWLDARDSVSGSFAKGYVVYDGVKGPGTTALTRADIRGAEQYVKVTSEGHGELHYRVNLDDKIAVLRQVKGTQALEFSDDKGVPRLRMTVPMALAGTEKVALKLHVVDCAIDTSPRAPRGRAVTDPGRSACAVVVSWDGAQGRDLLVDLAWTTTGSMARARWEHTASVLTDGKVLVAGGSDLSGVEMLGQLANGQSCLAASDCSSGHCVDGVCCEAACETPCMACSEALTGRATGMCSPIKAGEDPRNDCYSLGTGKCQTDGTCDGQGSCSSHLGEVCNSGKSACDLEDNNLKLSWGCSALGECKQGISVPCEPYKCVTDHCLTECSKIEDCQDGYVCVEKRCIKYTTRSYTCTNDDECFSKHCVDGVCCSSACDGLCESCDGAKTVSGSPGVCSPVLPGTDPDNECTKDNSNVCGLDGFCDGKKACEFVPKDTECGFACDNNASQVMLCDGAGVCSKSVSSAKDCAPFACAKDSGECNTACTNDTDCASGAQCNVQSGQCVVNNATCSDEFTLKDADGTEHDCKPYKCSGTTCRDSCSAPTDCASGYDCTDSKCVTGGEGSGEAEVKQDNGCGCSVPGGKPGKNTPWAMLGLAMAALGLARRRR